jgi:hypothetical protein
LAPAGDWRDREIEILVPLQQVTVVKRKVGILAMAQVATRLI